MMVYALSGPDYGGGGQRGRVPRAQNVMGPLNKN